MKAVAVVPAAAHFLLFLFATVATIPPSVSERFTCGEGEQMVCYAADGLAYAATDCFSEFDQAIERAMKACLENWSDLKGNRIRMSDAMEVDDAAGLRGQSLAMEDANVRIGTNLPNFNVTLNNTGALGSLVIGGGALSFAVCRKCIRDCVTLGTCEDRRRVLRVGNDLLEARKEDINLSETGENVIDLSKGRGNSMGHLRKDLKSRYDFKMTANCLDVVLTFEARHKCPGVEVSNGTFHECN